MEFTFNFSPSNEFILDSDWLYLWFDEGWLFIMLDLDWLGLNWIYLTLIISLVPFCFPQGGGDLRTSMYHISLMLNWFEFPRGGRTDSPTCLGDSSTWFPLGPIWEGETQFHVSQENLLDAQFFPVYRRFSYVSWLHVYSPGLHKKGETRVGVLVACLIGWYLCSSHMPTLLGLSCCLVALLYSLWQVVLVYVLALEG